MITVALCTIGGLLGAAGGHLAYDSAKLIRRDIRRRRKLTQETGASDGLG
jgi:hypothetical protein